ncbi:hypothetical protein PMZ80_000177 [Knufia obscura]|uniref:Cellular morphogenesis protein n=1 Tax=Knufia obscura TaxID=1635080 RepID=A0ABR0S0P9_9EURO|nr:hypothetical protein PMZ80_000177 [Knufia obscura]
MRLGPWPAKWLLGLSLASKTHAYTQVPSPNLDLNGLGQVALGGDFDAISIYSYEGQTEGIQGNGTHSILQQLPDGMYSALAETDARIEDICAFSLKNGTLLGVIIAGNFTSVGGIGAQSVAFIDGQTGEISPHPGIQGTVNAVYCDNETDTAYLGGTFDAAGSSNAIAWTASGSWANLPFAGFDAPVTSITKGPAGHIIFGGSFTGLKNMTRASDDEGGELINLDSARVTSVANITNGMDIVCPSNDSTTTAWQLEDNTAGSWTASMRYGFEPSRLRLYNNLDGRGVKNWRFTALPNTGIMNFTYTDPATGEQAHCDAICPLAQNSSLPYQDFYFVNRVGMNSLRLDVSAWYGQGAALRGIELYQNDTFVYAIEAVNPPSCLTASNTMSRATATGDWAETPSRSSVADYLTAKVSSATLNTTNIVFEPDISDRGNYTIVVYTPGCIQDSSCGSRGLVNVTGTLTSDGSNPFSTLISQRNDYDKYDQIYQGPVDAASGSFRPAVTVLPSKQMTEQTIVASRIRLSGNPSTGGLNGLFDFDPNAAVVDTDFSKSAINNAGTMLKRNAQVLSLATHNNTIYAAGGFTDDTFENIMSFADNEAQSLPNGGLNAAVSDIHASTDFLYVGGNFTGTNEDGPSGLENVAAYNYADHSWVALGAGVDGAVSDIVPFKLNITAGEPEDVIAFSGTFSNIRATGGSSEQPADGLAVWVPSRSNWLQNLGSERQLLAGMLCSYTTLPNGTWLGAGTLISLGQAMSGIAGLGTSDGAVAIQQLPIELDSSSATSSSSSSKRALLSQQSITGVVTGAYDTDNGRNVTILGGHFTARTNTSSVQNLLFLDGSNNEVSGLPSGMDDNSTFVALSKQGDVLFAGGRVTGQINNTQVQGLVLYDLAERTYRSPQPAALEGEDVIVNSFASQPRTSNVYVGGSFESTAQGLTCVSICMYDTSSNFWSTPGGGLSGTITALHFLQSTRLLAAGNLTISDTQTSLAEYDTEAQSWTVFNSAALPGPVTAFAKTKDDNVFWVAGTAESNNSAYVVRVDGNGAQSPVTGLLDAGSNILGLQLMPLTNGNGHGSSRYLDNDKDLLVMGQLNLAGFGRASAALFNGTTMQPFILSVNSAGEPGSISALFSSNDNPAVASNPYRHSNGIAILVAFCAALGTIFLIILAGMILNRIQRKRAGYSTLPSVPYQDKNMNINRVPPERLFASMGQRTPGAPAV